jgi:peptidyl-prolyl cis-trans isomerase C
MKALPSRLALGLMAGLTVFAAHASETTATVNGKAIPAERFKVVLTEQQSQGAADSAELRDAVREELIRREVLSQEASKRGLDKKADVQAQMELARQAILIRAYLQDWIKTNGVSDADIRKEYDGIVSRMGGKEYNPRHILVETEDAAKAIIAKLQGGTKFEELATQSLDPGSRERGGDLGWSNPGMFVKPFSDAMVKLEKGKYTTTPVKSDFGYHVIQMQDIRPLTPPPFDEVKPQLQQRMQQQKVEAHIVDLRNKAAVK